MFSKKNKGIKPAKSKNPVGKGAQPRDKITGDNKIKNNCFFNLSKFEQSYQNYI